MRGQRSVEEWRNNLRNPRLQRFHTDFYMWPMVTLHLADSAQFDLGVGDVSNLFSISTRFNVHIKQTIYCHSFSRYVTRITTQRNSQRRPLLRAPTPYAQRDPCPCSLHISLLYWAAVGGG